MSLSDRPQASTPKCHLVTDRTPAHLYRCKPAFYLYSNFFFIQSLPNSIPTGAEVVTDYLQNVCGPTDTASTNS